MKYFTILALPDTSIACIVQRACMYSQGAGITLIAKPNEGYIFKYWVEDTTIVPLDSVSTFIVNSPRNLVANFQKTPNCIDFKNTMENKFNLFQDYPNPFNPATVIRYSLLSVSQGIQNATVTNVAADFS